MFAGSTVGLKSKPPEVLQQEESNLTNLECHLHWLGKPSCANKLLYIEIFLVFCLPPLVYYGLFMFIWGVVGFKHCPPSIIWGQLLSTKGQADI